MNRFMLITVALVLSAGCASTNVGSPSEFDKLKAEMAQLRADNDTLKRTLKGNDELPRTKRAPLPPPARLRRGLPQNYAWMTPPEGCESGVLSLEIRNYTGEYLKVFMDGEELIIRGSRAGLPMLPPNKKLYVCLSSTGHHSFEGKAYAVRGNPLGSKQFVYVGRFSRDVSYTRLRGAYPRHKLSLERRHVSR